MTLEEVAREAGVSTATVSRVLNQAEGVRESTRRRVLSAVRSLGYAPNLHAASLATGRSRILGVVVSNVDNPFFLDIFRAMDEAALAAGHTVMMEHTNYEPQRLASSVASLIGLRPSGLALIVSEMDPALLADIARRKLPTVLYDNTHDAPTISSIRVRYALGMRRAVEYLRSLGHRRMAFVGHHAGLTPLHARKQSFVDTIHALTGDAEFAVVEQEDTPHGGKAAAARLLDSGFHPTAILCVNDFMAVGVLRELRDRGLRVPEDISVTGFDNILLSEFTHPPLTTLNIPRRRIGAVCCELLLRDAELQTGAVELDIEPELVVRESTGPAPRKQNVRRRRRVA